MPVLACGTPAPGRRLPAAARARPRGASRAPSPRTPPRLGSAAATFRLPRDAARDLHQTTCNTREYTRQHYCSSRAVARLFVTDFFRKIRLLLTLFSLLCLLLELLCGKNLGPSELLLSTRSLPVPPHGSCTQAAYRSRYDAGSRQGSRVQAHAPHVSITTPTWKFASRAWNKLRTGLNK